MEKNQPISSNLVARLLCERVFTPTIMIETSNSGLAAASKDFHSANQFWEEFYSRNCLDHLSQLFHLSCFGDKAAFPGFYAARFLSESDINAACASNDLPLHLGIAPLSQFRNKSATPWYDNYRRRFLINLGNTRTSETDTFLHPVACIYAVCSNGNEIITDLLGDCIM